MRILGSNASLPVVREETHWKKLTILYSTVYLGSKIGSHAWTEVDVNAR